MAVEVKSKGITEEEYLGLGEDVRAEIIDGELMIDMAANKIDHTLYGTQLSAFLLAYVRPRKLGRVGGDMAAFKLKETPGRGIKDALVPDVFYVSYQRLPPGSDLDILPTFAPDLAVEIISETESHTGILKKTATYLDHGTQMVIHLIPSLEQVHVFTADNRTGTVLTHQDTLTGGDLLPGFEVPIRALFELDDDDLDGETIRRLMDV